MPIADNTLGTQVLGNNNNFAITGGLTKGQNTFHSFVDSGKIGNSGNINFDVDSLSIASGSQLLSSSSGLGNAGNISIKAAQGVDISGQEGDLITSLKAFIGNSGTGNAGNITIDANSFSLRNAAQIQASSSGKDNAGNVRINAQGLLGTQFRPRQTRSSDITASSDFGQSGNISINTPGIDPGKDTSKLPAKPLDASKQITQRCNVVSPKKIINFTLRVGVDTPLTPANYSVMM